MNWNAFLNSIKNMQNNDPQTKDECMNLKPRSKNVHSKIKQLHSRIFPFHSRPHINTHTENSRQRTSSDILSTPIWPFQREMVCSEERDWHEAFSRPNKVCNVCVCVSVSIVVREKEDWGSKGETCVLREKKWEKKKNFEFEKALWRWNNNIGLFGWW